MQGVHQLIIGATYVERKSKHSRNRLLFAKKKICNFVLFFCIRKEEDAEKGEKREEGK